jgi:hypothetical protein
MRERDLLQLVSYAAIGVLRNLPFEVVVCSEGNTASVWSGA